MNSQQVKILIIDDNPAIYEDFKKILTLNKSSLAAKKLDQMTSALFGDEQEDVALLSSSSSTIELPMFVIDYANQGEAGVERIREAYQSKLPYVLAFVDIRMPPGIDGVETVKKIWEIDKDIQIVVCTAFSDYSWEAMVENLGTKDNLLIIHKPFDNVTVRQMACALNKKWSLLKDHQQHQELLEKKVQKRTESLAKSLSITRATLNSSAEGIMVLSENGTIKDYNQNFCTLFDIPPELCKNITRDTLHKHLIQKVNADSKQVLRKIFEESKIEQLTNNHFELILLNGKILDCIINPYKIKDEVHGMVLNVRDLTKRVSLEKKLKYHATHDYLTGLQNRKSLISGIARLVSGRNDASPEAFQVLFLDLDSFKAINDTFGHETGDTILKHVAQTINRICDKDASVGRLGGDEFVIVRLGDNNKKDIDDFCEKLINAVNEEILVYKQTFNIKVSVGIAKYPIDSKKGSQLLKKADIAMYEAKKRGGNQYNYYKTEYDLLSKEIFEKEQALERAFKNNELVIYYQPQINVVNGEIIAVEALIRWQNRDLGLLNAGEFIHHAEHSNLITQIGQWVLIESCKQNKAWQDMGLPKFKVAVNVSQLQIQQDNFIDTIRIALKESKLDPEYLCIELSENIFMDNDKLVNVANQIKELGASIAFDDFGAGRVGLNNLVKVPVQQIKIDKLFVSNMFQSKTDEVIVKAILHMAKELNVEVVAEGIETPEQMKMLSDYGCSNMQGYYFSKAMSPSSVTEFFEQVNQKNRTDKDGLTDVNQAV